MHKNLLQNVPDPYRQPPNTEKPLPRNPPAAAHARAVQQPGAGASPSARPGAAAGARVPPTYRSPRYSDRLVVAHPTPEEFYKTGVQVGIPANALLTVPGRSRANALQRSGYYDIDEPGVQKELRRKPAQKREFAFEPAVIEPKAKGLGARILRQIDHRRPNNNDGGLK